MAGDYNVNTRAHHSPEAINHIGFTKLFTKCYYSYGGKIFLIKLQSKPSFLHLVILETMLGGEKEVCLVHFSEWTKNMIDIYFMSFWW